MSGTAGTTTTIRTPSRADYSLASIGAESYPPPSSSSSSSARSPPSEIARRRSSTPTTSPSPSPLRSPPPSHPPAPSSLSPNAHNSNPTMATLTSSSSSLSSSPPPTPPLHSSTNMASAGLRKELDQRLSAYLPAVVRRHLESHTVMRVPDTHETTVVSMFADVSGFTAMTESLAARGPVGAEFLGRHLNSYFEQLLRLVSSAGGDVFKFAGDAMLIFWPANKDDTLETLLRRCVQCALRIQSHLHKAELAPGVVLSVKMGIGIGGATIAHLGGVSDGATARMEYIAVGPALEQAFASEHQAEPGQVICSPQCWQLIASYFDGEPVRVGSLFQKVTAVISPIKLVSRRASVTGDDPQLHARMKQYVSRAVWPYLDAHDEFWGSELRDVTVLFVNVGFSEDDLAKMLDVRGLQRLQDAFRIVQKCIYEYEGTINKFLVDDKGSTLIAAFGLPPVTHENDPIRGILASLAICAALGAMGLKASVGITTGVALCGVVGHQGNRREYTVLGDIVNLSARLMQKAKSEHGGVITDEATKLYTHDVLHFEERPEIFVKGKNDSIKIHRPYPRMSILMEYHMSTRSAGVRKNAVCAALPTSPRAMAAGAASGGGGEGGAVRLTPIPNVMENMHRVQVRDAQRRISMRAEKQAADSPLIIESDAFKKIRETLLQACSGLNRFSNGGSFVLEGDIGVGKTVLLRTTLTAPETGCYNVCMGTASSFATRKPYAVWAEIITKCALEGYGDSCGLLSSTMNGKTPEESAMRNLQTNDFSREAERRRRVAAFVRRKIRDGAAPNTTLVRYAYLLNGILDTTFEAQIDEDSTVGFDGKTSRSGGGFVRASNGGRKGDNNDDEEEMVTESDVTSPSKLQVKEEDLAAWFLGLLEMDLATSRRVSEEYVVVEASTKYSVTRPADSTPEDNGSSTDEAAQTAPVASMRPISSSNSRTSSTNRSEHKVQQQREKDWKPTELDLSGILLLCALHAMSRDKATVFCLDNAMFMDDKSWVLATIIAKYFTNCLVVIGTRPPSLALAEHTQSSSFRKRLRVLKRMRPSIAVTMEPLGATQIHDLALQILQVKVIPNELVSILISRSQGNPLFLHEIIGEMLQQQVIKVDEKRYRCYLQVQEAGGDKSGAHFCFYCYFKFAHSKEKHRCKSCGYVFCATCTPTECRKKLLGSTGEPVRHCRNCYTLSSTRRPSSDRSLAAAASAIAAGTFSGASSHGPSSSATSHSHGHSFSLLKGKHKRSMRSLFQPEVSNRTATPTASLKSRIALRPPKTVKSVLTTVLDQLSVSQRMLLKTASVIGSVFEEELLRGASPIKAHLGRFRQDLDDLERLAMIRRLDTFIAGLKQGPGDTSGPSTATASTVRPPMFKVKYEFCHGFMQDVVRSQMLCSQLDKLGARIADCREQQEKELRQRFFEKAKDSLSRPMQVSVPAHPPSTLSLAALAIRRGSNPVNNQLMPPPHQRRRSFTSTQGIDEAQLQLTGSESGRRGSTRDQLPQPPPSAQGAPMAVPMAHPRASSSRLTSSASFLDDSQLTFNGTTSSSLLLPSPQRVLKTIPTFLRLKTGTVFVKKQSSLFAHLHFRGLTNARLWKKRFAVLHNARLSLQYDDIAGAKPRQGTSLFLKGAKVSACDPEVAAKVNCFQVEVNEWTKGKYLMNTKRFFVMGVQSEQEVENWVYMIRYAIESLENQSH